MFSDAEFGNSDNWSSQFGEIVFLDDKLDNCHVFKYSSMKRILVVLSVLGVEIFSFSDAFYF